jgi:hypothetical protein
MHPLCLITASVDGGQYLQMASDACDKATMHDISSSRSAQHIPEVLRLLLTPVHERAFQEGV